MRYVLAVLWFVILLIVWCGVPAYKRTEQARAACEARTCHTPWTKPRYENRIGCVCWERPE